ncbi:MAG: hypothetical protein ACYS47_21355, partial [Planctomycetota bacterium]
KSMSLDPEKRYPSALALRDEVSAFFAGRRLSAARYSAAEILWMWAARNRTAVATGLAMAALLLVASVLFVLSLTRARNEALDQKDIANAAEITAREAEAEARTQAKRAESLRHAAEVRAAESLVLQADALLAADRRADAEALYIQAKKELTRLGENPEGAVWGLLQIDKTNPPPLLSIRSREGYPHRVAFSPDGRTLLTSGSGMETTLWEATTGRVLKTFPKARDADRLAFLPGRDAFLAAIGNDALTFDLSSGEVRQTFQGHTGKVAGIALFADDRRFATASSDGTVRVWDIPSGAPLMTLQDRGQEVRSVAVTPDSRYAISYGSKKETVIWDLNAGKEARRFNALPGNSYGHVVFVWGGRSFMVSSGALMRRFDVDSELKVTNFIETGQNIRGLAPTPDGLRVVTAGDGRVVKIWDMHTGEMETWLYGHTAAIEGIALSPDGARLATAGRDGFLRVWDVREGEEKDLFRGSASPPYRAAVTADDRLAVTGSHMGIVRLWDVESGCEIRPYYGFGGEVRGVAITKEGDRIAGFGPKGLALWETGAPEPQARWIVGPNGPQVFHAVFSADGTRLLGTGTGDRIWSLWNVADGQEICGCLRNQGRGAVAVAFTPGESRCVGALADGALGIWELRDGREVRRTPVHHATVTSLDVSPDGRHALTGDQNGKIVLWDLETGEIRHAVSDREVSVENVAFLPGGQRFISSHFDEELRLWDSG